MERIELDNKNGETIERIKVVGQRISQKQFMRMERDTCNLRGMIKGQRAGFAGSQNVNTTLSTRKTKGCKYAHGLYSGFQGLYR